MGKYRDYNHGDAFYASTVDALMEATSTFVEGLRLKVNSTNTGVTASASSGSGQVSVALNGLWRYRSTDFTATHPTGTAGTYDIFATCSANSFTGTAPVAADPDATDYNWSLTILASGTTPSGVAEYRKIGETDWDGSKITALRQLQGNEDSTAPISPTSDTSGQIPVIVRLVSGQSVAAFEVRNSSGTVINRISSTGAVTTPSITLSAADGAESIGLSNRSSISFKNASTAKASISLNSSNALEVTDNSTSRVTIASGNGDLKLAPGASSGSVYVGTSASEKVGFFGSSGAVCSTGWSISNVTTDKVYDASNTTLNEVANTLGTLINALKGYGIISS